MSDLDNIPSDQVLGDEGLYQAAARLIEGARVAIAYNANAVTLASNWRLGQLIHVETLQRGRAAYGKQILAVLSQRLMAQYGKGFSESALNRMVQFAREYSELELTALPPEVSWSHVRLLLPLNSQARAFHSGEVSVKRLGVRELGTAIGRKAFERREIANAQIPEGSAVPLDAFRDPMLLDMLTLKDSYLEADLEEVILRDLEVFLLEVGHGFAFVGRQIRMPMGSKDYHLDLLFYSRPLSRLVAVELKIGEFVPEHEGQMRF